MYYRTAEREDPWEKVVKTFKELVVRRGWTGFARESGDRFVTEADYDLFRPALADQLFELPGETFRGTYMDNHELCAVNEVKYVLLPLVLWWVIACDVRRSGQLLIRSPNCYDRP